MAPASTLSQPRHYFLCGQAVNFERFVARGLAAQKNDVAPGTVQLIGQQPQQRLIGGRIDRRRGDFDAQLLAERLTNFVSRGARLQLYCKQHAIALPAQKIWNRHCIWTGAPQLCAGRASLARLQYKPSIL